MSTKVMRVTSPVVLHPDWAREIRLSVTWAWESHPVAGNSTRATARGARGSERSKLSMNARSPTVPGVEAVVPPGSGRRSCHEARRETT